jgi:hypothetical protein
VTKKDDENPEEKLEPIQEEEKVDKADRAEAEACLTKQDSNPTLTSALANKAAVQAVAELTTLRRFLKPRFNTPGEAFDELRGYSAELDRKTFMARVEEWQYDGNSLRLWDTLSEGGEIITIETFKQRLVDAGRMAAPVKKRISFGSVFLHAVEETKGWKKADYVEEDTWGPDPESSAPWQLSPIEILIDEAPYGFSDITIGQPSASGQPAATNIPRLDSGCSLRSDGSTMSSTASLSAAGEEGVEPATLFSPGGPKGKRRSRADIIRTRNSQSNKPLNMSPEAPSTAAIRKSNAAKGRRNSNSGNTKARGAEDSRYLSDVEDNGLEDNSPALHP